MTKTIVLLLMTTLLGSVHAANGQKSTKVPRIGFLTPENRLSRRMEAFRQGLRELGYVEGKNIAVEHRGSEDMSRLAELATELVREKVDVIVAQGRATTRARDAAAKRLRRSSRSFCAASSSSQSFISSSTRATIRFCSASGGRANTTICSWPWRSHIRRCRIRNRAAGSRGRDGDCR